MKNKLIKSQDLIVNDNLIESINTESNTQQAINIEINNNIIKLRYEITHRTNLLTKFLQDQIKLLSINIENSLNITHFQKTFLGRLIIGNTWRKITLSQPLTNFDVICFSEWDNSYRSDEFHYVTAKEFSADKNSENFFFTISNNQINHSTGYIEIAPIDDLSVNATIIGLTHDGQRYLQIDGIKYSKRNVKINQLENVNNNLLAITNLQQGLKLLEKIENRYIDELLNNFSILEPGTINGTQRIKITDSQLESISGTATNQQEVNGEFKELLIKLNKLNLTNNIELTNLIEEFFSKLKINLNPLESFKTLLIANNQSVSTERKLINLTTPIHNFSELQLKMFANNNRYYFKIPCTPNYLEFIGNSEVVFTFANTSIERITGTLMVSVIDDNTLQIRLNKAIDIPEWNIDILGIKNN